jgi:hypothetical protein
MFKSLKSVKTSSDTRPVGATMHPIGCALFVVSPKEKNGSFTVEFLEYGRPYVDVKAGLKVADVTKHSSRVAKATLEVLADDNVTLFDLRSMVIDLALASDHASKDEVAVLRSKADAVITKLFSLNDPLLSMQDRVANEASRSVVDAWLGSKVPAVIRGDAKPTDVPSELA